MKFNIRGENIEVTPALRDYVEKKVGRLERYFNEDITSDVYVTLKVTRDEHSVEVTIPMPKLLLRAEEKSLDMYASIDLVVEKLERQIRKYKTKIKRKFRQDGSMKQLFQEVNGQAEGTHEEETDDKIEIVRIKRFNLKPMDAEEAVLQMDLLGHNFFVFSDAETQKVSVVYKRKDGRYGLIQPE
ncbi:sigma 54 modulation protein/ribosomal protein S30EA [Caldalkalibacillus thermarum TA2.A1]|uniref:Ribosome hibernation promoting factor n=1 Tax=Caldalkalibacillus thermarum (strain TA2.A1) TaxID=986075 RepID=F5L4M7_CALTT|nr:ribosome-associated translation inhibitor RaiA [Caldalkalibacillus thermarum]EGL83693.1 sigma 54 modulation protein/ribosomal protein S30EA [Caldalkalibacillus thermarum TA2.A1]QZT33937.1 ribosome-associated translation inhibitor RaiA [Caldalkalibacillus thermarum TA2.A1]